MFVAVDHEGGLVSELHLKKVFSDLRHFKDYKGNNSQIIEVATNQAQEMKNLGVNLNFSPVVDVLNSDTETQAITQLDARAISNIPEEIITTAEIYISSQKQTGIINTLKHFPGIGSLDSESHTDKSNILNKSWEELREKDLLPFIELTKKDPETFVMLSHVILPQIDSKYPVSYSEKVIREGIRGELKIYNKLVTDDMSMAPGSLVNGGIGPNSRRALDAGVDYILISYDTDLYFEAMQYLLED